MSWVPLQPEVAQGVNKARAGPLLGEVTPGKDRLGSGTHRPKPSRTEAPVRDSHDYVTLLLLARVKRAAL